MQGCVEIMYISAQTIIFTAIVYWMCWFQRDAGQRSFQLSMLQLVSSRLFSKPRPYCCYVTCVCWILCVTCSKCVLQAAQQRSVEEVVQIEHLCAVLLPSQPPPCTPPPHWAGLSDPAAPPCLVPSCLMLLQSHAARISFRPLTSPPPGRPPARPTGALSTLLHNPLICPSCHHSSLKSICLLLAGRAVHYILQAELPAAVCRQILLVPVIHLPHTSLLHLFW